ncbi:MAG: hypothetical protein KC502_17880 [Myxococcales bacterium]|nr:hypothetical protein [Myxococcales bacterium]
MADSERGFYLVALLQDGPSLVANPCVVRGQGMERYGAEADVLTSLDTPSPRQAIAVGRDLFALDSQRVARTTLTCDGTDADVFVVRPDGPIPAVDDVQVRRWLAVALLASGLELTTSGSVHSAVSKRPTGLTMSPEVDAAFTDKPAAGLARWLPLAGALVLGLLLGALVFGGGGSDGREAVADVAQAESPTEPAAVAAPVAADPAPVTAAPAPATAPAGQEADTTSAGADAAPAVVESDAGSAVAAAPSAPVVPANPVADDAASSSFAALPIVSLWTGAPPPVGIKGHCNPFGDLVLAGTVNGKLVERIVVCGLFTRRSSLGKTRSAVCLPKQGRCVAMSQVSLDAKPGADTLTPADLPSVVCTPVSGKPYGLRKYGKKLIYRNGAARLGMTEHEGTTFKSQCGRRAPYVASFWKLRRAARRMKKRKQGSR